MIPKKQFLFFLLDTITGNAYYRNSNGIISTVSVLTASQDVTLTNSPVNWMDTQLEYLRNTTYNGINRSYTTPLEIDKDVQAMVVELFLLGYGTEANLSIAIFKFNSQPKAGEPQYLLYFKGALDLSKLVNKVLDSSTIPIMEGGAAQLLKNYESTVLQIPCDGSITENQKINFDGLWVNDTFYYQIIGVQNIGFGLQGIFVFTPIACVFLNNDGDNFGIIHNDQSFDLSQQSNTYPAPSPFNLFPSQNIDPINLIKYASTSTNYLFLSTNNISPIISGNIVIKFNNTRVYPTSEINLYLVTSFGQGIPLTTGRILGRDNKVVSINFSQKVFLQPNEKLFLMIIGLPLGVGGSLNIDIVSGNFKIEFSSYATSTRAWAITLYDAFKLAWQQINTIASTYGLSYNFPFKSDLLQSKLNFLITSGDALRASGDPTYKMFFNNIQIGNTLQTTYGTVLKVTLKELYTLAKVILNGVLGTSFNGKTEQLYLESFANIFDSSKVDFSLGEVSDLVWQYDEGKSFSDLVLGYTPQTYDQKAGKFEYNTTLQMKAPINSFQKKLELVTTVRTDTYGIERLRSNIGSATSTTKNDSDNSVFLINVDVNNWVYDYFQSYFFSGITDPTNSSNQNTLFAQNIPYQPINLPFSNGGYFTQNVDNSIIIFSNNTTPTSQIFTLNITGTIDEKNKPPLAPHDAITIIFWYNGIALYTDTVTVNSANTTINISHTFTRVAAYQDCFYITLSTTPTADVNISLATLNIGTSSLSANNIPVEGGVWQKMLSWQTIIPSSTPYVLSPATPASLFQYGFEYFTFNSLDPNTIFDLELGVNGFIEGSTNNFIINVFINGIIQAERILINGSVARTPFISPANLLVSLQNKITRAYSLGDIVFITATATDSIAQITRAYLNITSNYIKAYGLKRESYLSLSGIPNISTDANGIIQTNVSGAPYNIEELTPGYLRDVIWADYIKSCFLDKTRGDLLFQTLSKNQYLSRSTSTQTITENANKQIADGNRLFYPITGSFKTNVPIGFAELMSKTVNAHIHASFLGVDFYFFANKLSQKPALNESQEWTFLLSPQTDLAKFSNITNFYLPDMPNNSIYVSSTLGVQFVPYNRVVNPLHHTFNRDTNLFKDQVSGWLNQDGFGQLVQIGDKINLQFITNGLSPVNFEIHNCIDDKVIVASTPMYLVSSPAIIDKQLWQIQIDTSTFSRGNYYFVITAAGQSILISEPQLIKEPWECEGSVLLEAVNSFNTQGLVFDTGFNLTMRFEGGFNNLFKQKYIGKHFIDQPQDVVTVGAIPYEVTNLFIGRGGGVPDYMAKKVLRMFLMDDVKLDGEGFTLNEGSQLGETFTKGAPMKYYNIEIRPATAKTGIVVDLSTGLAVGDSNIIVTVNPDSFGVNISNSSGTNGNIVTDIIVSP